MLTSRSFRKQQQREERKAQAVPKTHSQIMKARGDGRSISGTGEIKAYKGGTRIPITQGAPYKVFSFNMPGSNGSGEYKITAGSQTLIVLSGVLFVNKTVKGNVENTILRADQHITFSKGDVVSYSPNATSMSALLIESGDIKTRKSSDPIVNNTGVEVYNNSRRVRRAADQAVAPRRREKTQAEREAYGQAYMQARGVEVKNTSVVANVAGEVARRQPIPQQNDQVNSAAAVVEGENPQPMGDKGE